MIRAANAHDVKAVTAIMNDVITKTTATFTTVPKTEVQVAKDIASKEPFLVAEIDGLVCGYTRSFSFRGGPGYAHVAEYSIAVTDDTRGQGAGRALFSKLCTLAAAGGIAHLIGAVSSDNQAALRFHEAMGFERVGTLPDMGRKWGKSLGLVFMQKRL